MEILQVEVMSFLFLAMNKYLTDTTSFLPEAFTQDKTDIKAYSLAALAFYDIRYCSILCGWLIWKNQLEKSECNRILGRSGRSVTSIYLFTIYR